MGEFPNKATQFKPGNPGGGRPKNRPIAAALKDLLDKDDGKAIKAIAAVALKHALKGDFRHMKEIMDRIDGKVLEQLDVTTDGSALNPFPGLTPEQYEAVSKIAGGPGEEE